MQIYFSCSITGGRDDQEIYQAIVEHLIAKGFDVPTARLAEPGIIDEEGWMEPEDVFRRDVDWVLSSDVLIAEVSTPSHGVGYEIALAELNNKPILCCYEQGKRVSKMILGSDYAKQQVHSYASLQELKKIIDDFLVDYL